MQSHSQCGNGQDPSTTLGEALGNAEWVPFMCHPEASWHRRTAEYSIHARGVALVVAGAGSTGSAFLASWDSRTSTGRLVRCR